MDALFMAELEQELMDDLNEGKETTMAYAEKMDTAAGRVVTPFERLASAVDRLEKATSGVSEMASKLVGEGPPSASNGINAKPTGSGMFGGIEEQANRIDELVSNIANHVLRVDQRI